MDLEGLKKKLEQPLRDINIIIDDIEYVKEGKLNFLRITLDKINGLDMDTIVEATHIINPIVDEYDTPLESFILDVISKERGGV